MYIKSIEATKENIVINYPTLYISKQSNNSVNIQKIILSGSQNLEINNTVNLYIDPEFEVNLIKR